MKIIDWIKSLFPKKPEVIDYAALKDKIDILIADGKRIIPKTKVPKSVAAVQLSNPNLKSEFSDYAGRLEKIVSVVGEIEKKSCPNELIKSVLKLKQVMIMFKSFSAWLKFDLSIKLIKFKGEK